MNVQHPFYLPSHLSFGSALIHSNVPFQEELIAHLLIAIELHLLMIQAVVPEHRV